LTRSEGDRWYNRVPTEIGWSVKRPAGDVWHFLLPDPGMSAYDQKIVRPLAAAGWKELEEWRREFNQPFDEIEVDNLMRISRVVDELFDDVADRLAEVRSSVNDEYAIWPAKPTSSERHLDFSEKMKRLANFHGEGVKNAVSWKRLKTVMDAWSALWFWPVTEAHLLPARATFIADMALVLEGKMGERIPPPAAGPAQGRLFETKTVPGRDKSGSLFTTEDRAVLGSKNLFGDVDVEKLIGASSWLPTAMEIAATRKFMHFDLEFADVMRERGGFDLVIGNPPWRMPDWNDPEVLAQFEPSIAIRGSSAAEVERAKPTILGDRASMESYLEQHVAISGTQSFLSSASNFPFLGGGRQNLYKCFIDLALRITSNRGAAALIHQDGHLSDPNAATFRSKWYKRIRYHFQFRNELRRELFADVDNGTFFSLNIYRGEDGDVAFDHIASLFAPRTIDESYNHDGIGEIPRVRENGSWNTRGHKNRIVRVDTEVLKDFATVIESSECKPLESRFLFPYSAGTVGIFREIGRAQSFNKAVGAYQMRSIWNETNATKKDHILAAKVAFPADMESVVVTGPAFYIGNPFYKTLDADEDRATIIDHDLIPVNYIPRTNYQRLVSKEVYESKLPALSWAPFERHTDAFRIAFRNMLPPKNERTLIAALIPPGMAHVHTVESLAFEREEDLISSYPLWLSLPYDFIVKAATISHFHQSTLESFPWARLHATAKERALRLACLTQHYANLWNRHRYLASEAYGWSSDDCRLVQDRIEGNSPWSKDTAIRSPFARRYALVEIDVLVAQALGLSLDDLLEMYRTHFSVFKSNEDATWYDANGKVVWTMSKGIQSLGWRDPAGRKPNEATWLAKFSDMQAGEELTFEAPIKFLSDESMTVPRIYRAPFSTCDREADYRRAWAYFEDQTTRKVA
jgi:hypothetical protein